MQATRGTDTSGKDSPGCLLLGGQDRGGRPWGTARRLSIWAGVSVAHDEAAVDLDRLARHVVGVGAGQEDGEARQVLGDLWPAERDPGGTPLPGLAPLPAFERRPVGVDLLPPRRGHGTPAQAVARDPGGG